MAFTDRDLDQYLIQHEISGARADYIRLARAGLARDVGGGGYTCVVTEYQSHKMGTTVNAESRTGECLYAIHLDFDADVVAFFEQPPTVDCYRVTRRGIRRLCQYTPDMLVLSNSGPYVAQVKPDQKLIALAASNDDWVEAEGTYRDLAAERAFAEYPLQHVVVSTLQLDKQRGANISLLLQSLDYGSPDQKLANAVVQSLDRRLVMSLAELADANELVDHTPLIHLIATHRIFTDLSAFSLVEPDACFVSGSPALLREDVFDAWRHLRRDPSGTLTAAVSQELLPLERHLVRGVEIVDKLDAGIKGRSARRWRRRVEAGLAKGMSRMAAASPRYDLSGNRSPKRPPVVLAYAEHVIRSHWGNDTKPTHSALWRLYKTAAEEWHPGYRHVSAPTFREIRRQTVDKLAYSRGGRRAANAAQPPTDVHDRAIRADRPFQMASCDHYLCDIHCIVLNANGQSYVMRPWLTVLRDCYTGSVLAFWLSLRAPSRRSCALIMRQCLRLHGRLPEWLIVDRGSDFRSTYFSELMSHCQVHLMFRPSGHPRYGSEAERWFGQFKSFWLSARAGHRANVREVRAVSGSHQPQKLACLTLLDLWKDLEEFNRWFDRRTVESALASPAVLAAEGLQRFSCSGRRILYDERFLIATAVDDGRRYKLDPQRGLHIDAFRYWNPQLSTTHEQSLEIRRDPEDPYRIYALLHGQWIVCLASRAPAYDRRDPLAQAVEGVVMLDGAQAREVAKEDEDRALIQAVRRRTLEPSLALETPPHMHMPVLPRFAGENDDYFSDLAARKLDVLEAGRWD